MVVFAGQPGVTEQALPAANAAPRMAPALQGDEASRLAAVQARLLNHVAGSLKPGGRLVYAVCTLTRAETTAVADAFTAAHPEFEPVAAQTLWPQDLNANGMFIATWRRK